MDDPNIIQFHTAGDYVVTSAERVYHGVALVDLMLEICANMLYLEFHVCKST